MVAKPLYGLLFLKTYDKIERKEFGKGDQDEGKSYRSIGQN